MTVIVFSFSFSLKLFWFRIVKNAVNIHVFQSRTDVNGKPIGENGSYLMRDGSIHIDLNAGNLGQGMMAYTIAHEFTHFMEQQSPAKFQAFTDAVFTELDMDVEAEIEDKAEKLKRQRQEQYKNASRDTLLEDARSEVVAEACETMLTDTDAAQRIGKTLQAKDATLFEKVKQWFRDLAAKLRKAYKGLNPDSQIAKYAKKTIQQVDGLVQLWADMAVDAAENYREGTGNENAELGSGVKMQLRYADGNSVVWIEENILKENDGEPVHQYIANYIAEHIGEVYTIIESGQKVYIGEDLPGEYTQSKYTKAILKNNAKVLKAKNRAAANLGEMIEIATNRRWEETKHTHSKDAKYGIYRYDTRFGFPIKNHQGNVASANVYNAELLIRNASDGKKYLYDIVSIKKDTASSDWLTKKAASAAANAAGQKGDVSRNSIRNPEPVVNQKNSDRDDVESEFYNAGVKYSSRVTDKDTLSFLDNQETITTYKTMQIVDGRLYPPMAARIDGKHEDYSVLGVWEQATEHPELIKGNGKFKLDKGKGQGSIDAAYNPYMHSSNLVINDQFTGAYTRDNLVTVECEVPASELTSGYHAQYAKDSVGWHAWHTGTVAGAIRKAKGIERQVFLSRWIKPVRIVTDAEVASMYRDLLDGTDIAVPDNVVTPSLLSELKKTGVTISESGRVMNSGDPGKKISNTGLVEPTSTADAADRGNTSTNSIRNPEQVVNKKFSMRDNVEKTKDLIAVHNLSEEKLLKSLNLGGLPMPSIAILRAKDGHNKFGDISLVFSKDTIDPELSRVNKVYSADAWTPTYPKIDYKANDRVEDRISSKYNELVKRFGYDAAKPLYRYAFHVCNIGCWVWA